MHIRPKAYLQVLSRRVHIWLSRLPSPTNQEASPLLIFIAVVLALLLAILEVDRHGATLQFLGLPGNLTGTQPEFTNFMGP
jgi:hypothetical protein